MKRRLATCREKEVSNNQEAFFDASETVLQKRQYEKCLSMIAPGPLFDMVCVFEISVDEYLVGKGHISRCFCNQGFW